MSYKHSDIDMIKPVNYGVCKCYWCEEQTHIEKTTYKCMHCNLNLQTKY